MSRRRRHAATRRLRVALLAAALAACGGGDERGAPEAPPGADAAEAGPPPAWDEPGSGSPLISLSANDAAELELPRGWPLVMRASLLHPAAFDPAAAPTEPIVLAGAGAALRLRVADETGAPQPWPLHAAAPPADELRLEPDGSVDAVWWLDGGETAALADGRYTLVAELDTTRAATGWQGTAASPPVPLAIAAEPAPLPPERAAEKRRLELTLLLLRGELDAARAAVDALLAERPDDVVALEASGDLAAASGRTQDAFAAYSRALDVFFERSPRPPEPPWALLRKRQAVMQDAVVPR